jgi:hypothetical protein
LKRPAHDVCEQLSAPLLDGKALAPRGRHR